MIPFGLIGFIPKTIMPPPELYQSLVDANFISHGEETERFKLQPL
jgi:hypothetical protein